MSQRITRLAPAVLWLLVAVAVGNASDCEPEMVFCGEASADHLGSSVAGAGDVNNDGVVDVVVGAPQAAGNGKVYVYSGKDQQLLHEFLGESPGDQFGFAVGSAGDANNDDYADIIVGAVGYGGSAGRAYVFSGFDGSRLLTVDGRASGDQLGHSVAGLGDLDGDNHDDFAVGAIGDDAAGVDRGAVYVYSGADTSLLFTHTGESYTEFGFSIAAAGDVDQDSYTDLIVGQPKYSSDLGRVFVYSGQSGNLLSSFLGQGFNHGFGWSVAAMGDVNHDGHDDIVVGAPFYDG